MYLWNHLSNEEEREKYHIQKADSVIFIIGHKYQYGTYSCRTFRVNGG